MFDSGHFPITIEDPEAPRRIQAAERRVNRALVRGVGASLILSGALLGSQQVGGWSILPTLCSFGMGLIRSAHEDYFRAKLVAKSQI